MRFALTHQGLYFCTFCAQLWLPSICGWKNTIHLRLNVERYRHVVSGLLSVNQEHLQKTRLFLWQYEAKLCWCDQSQCPQGHQILHWFNLHCFACSIDWYFALEKAARTSVVSCRIVAVANHSPKILVTSISQMVALLSYCYLLPWKSRNGKKQWFSLSAPICDVI